MGHGTDPPQEMGRCGTRHRPTPGAWDDDVGHGTDPPQARWDILLCTPSLSSPFFTTSTIIPKTRKVSNSPSVALGHICPRSTRAAYSESDWHQTWVQKALPSEVPLPRVTKHPGHHPTPGSCHPPQRPPPRLTPSTVAGPVDAAHADPGLAIGDGLWHFGAPGRHVGLGARHPVRLQCPKRRLRFVGWVLTPVPRPGGSLQVIGRRDAMAGRLLVGV